MTNLKNTTACSAAWAIYKLMKTANPDQPHAERLKAAFAEAYAPTPVTHAKIAKIARKIDTDGPLTELEIKALKEIPLDDFYENDLDSILWLDTFVDCCSIDNKILRGVLSSLKKKGYINMWIHKSKSGKNEDTLTLTDTGRAWMERHINGRTRKELVEEFKNQ